MKIGKKIQIASGIALVASLAAGAHAQTATNTPVPVVTNLPPPPPKNPWTGDASLGLTLTRGNSRALLAVAQADAKKKWDDNELLLNANGAYGKNTGVVNAESIDGNAQYNRNFTPRFYFGVKGDALSDHIADIDYRLTLAPLAGYYLIKNTNDTLAVEAGPAGVLQKLGETTRGYATLRLGERYEHKFSATARLWESFEILPQVDRFSNYYINAEIGIESALAKSWSLKTYIDDTYYAVPAPGRLKNDVKLVSAIAYKF
jgi:putative salt-induced outer membrane protein YdiY